jgi:hypothetical protein
MKAPLRLASYYPRAFSSHQNKLHHLSEAITQARTRNNTIQDISSERLMTLTDMTTEVFY